MQNTIMYSLYDIRTQVSIKNNNAYENLFGEAQQNVESPRGLVNDHGIRLSPVQSAFVFQLWCGE